MNNTPVTICVLTFDDYPALAKAALGSILRCCDRSLYKLVVGANAVCEETRNYLESLHCEGSVDRLHISPVNLNKCPMMRQMFAGVDTEFIWWFDDDSTIFEANALTERLRIARESPATTMIWGHQFYFGHERDFSYGTDVVGFVRSAQWYRNLEPPSWLPGGKGETDFEGRGCGDGRWFFMTGGCWLIRTQAVRLLDWPDRRLIKRNDDVFLCEAIRQQGWQMHDIGPIGVAINTQPRRGSGEDAAAMAFQMGAKPLQLDLGGWFFPEEATIYQQLASGIRAGTVVEVGVWKGRSIANILDICRANGNRLVAVDTWRPSPDDPDYTEARTRDIRQVFMDNLRLLGHYDTVQIMQEDSAAAANNFADQSVDLLFLDADHSYAAVKRDLYAWLPKMRPGGILCGHDYIWKEGVRRAVHDVLGEQVTHLGGSIWRMTESAPSPAGGCIFIPTFQDTDLLALNYGGRPELTANMAIWVFDDNFDRQECDQVKALCRKNGWHYRPSDRKHHGCWQNEYSNLCGYNRFIWESMTSLGRDYDYVVKMDTDAYVIDSNWHEEMRSLLSRRTAVAGTPEVRPARDVMSYWTLAEKAGFQMEVPEYVTHIQGGIYGMSRSALQKLAAMGFLDGEHIGFAEDCYMSYSCQLLGVEFITTKTIGSWFRPYRPKLSIIRDLKAIHPLTLTEWRSFLRTG